MCDALRDLVPSVKFKKREKHLWRSVTFRTLLHGCFSHFLNCVHSTKSRNVQHVGKGYGCLCDLFYDLISKQH